MGRFNDRARQCLAVLARITGVKKEKPEHNNEVDTKVDCSTCSHGLEPHTVPKHESSVASRNGWKYRPGVEFPWRLEQVVEEQENWRGTWVLEVKDLRAMDWGTTRVPKADIDGRGGRYQRQPTRHLPFPADDDGYRKTFTGGQDDRMVQLGKR